ncbi:ATP-binding protein [Phascolarctobacterium sp.]
MCTTYDLDYIKTVEEGLYFDRKSSRISPKDIVKPIIAFANANGGALIIGAEDDKSLTGFNYTNSHTEEEYRTAIIRNCIPVPRFRIEKIPYDKGENDFVLLILVDLSVNQVIKTTNEKVYLRSADQSIELTHSQITALEYDKGQRFFEDQILEDATFNDVDETLLNSYKEKMKATSKTSIEILEARGLIRNGKLTNAAILLFGKNPTKFLPGARIRFIRYNGKKAGFGQNINIIKEETFDDSIPTVINKIAFLVKSQLRDFQTLTNDGKFEVIQEYPEFAWFEGIVNALTHRDYSISGDHIRVTMFDDRLEIFSPGKLPNIVTLENMKKTRFSRNPRIARFLSDFGWVKELNEGVNRIYAEMQRFFLNDPVYSEPNNNSVLLTLENSIISRHLRAHEKLFQIFSQESWNTLNDNEKIILQYIYSKNTVTSKEAGKLINRSQFTARRILKKLAEKGFLVWSGSSDTDPAQYYSLNTASLE